ncbi:hypothetical protein [Arthrobacter sp. KBS0702]|nr:hypothetical protein [Arthrobacter sp. KBS0702]
MSVGADDGGLSPATRRERNSSTTAACIDKGKLGVATGEGFYRY